MIRIRVHPQGAGRFGGFGGYGGYGGYGRYGQNAHLRLQHEKQKNSLRLNYERALFRERLNTVKLQSALQFGGGMRAGGFGYNPLQSVYAGANPYGGYGLGAGLGSSFGLGGIGSSSGWPSSSFGGFGGSFGGPGSSFGGFGSFFGGLGSLF